MVVSNGEKEKELANHSSPSRGEVRRGAPLAEPPQENNEHIGTTRPHPGPPPMGEGANVAPQLFIAKVMHKRLFPKVNQFTYGVYYVALPLAKLEQNFNGVIPCPTPYLLRGRIRHGIQKLKEFARSQLYSHKLDSHFRGNDTKQMALTVNQFAPLSFYAKDHGAKDGSSLEDWIRGILAEHGLNDVVDDIVLICMPRVLGYVFNPVSFWMCLDKAGQLRAVLCEVNNTFGETHSYLCAHEDRRPITQDDWLSTDKVFHVSPFLPREGNYTFRFALVEDKLGIWIDYNAANGEKQLITTLHGKLEPMTKASLRRAFWSHPLVTVKTIMLIHWQALKLFSKGIKYIVKPEQKEIRLSTTNLTKE